MRGAQFRRKIKRAVSELDSSKFHTGVSGNQRKDESSNISHFRNCVEVDANLVEIPFGVSRSSGFALHIKN